MKQLQSRHIMLIAALCGMMSNCLGVLFNVGRQIEEPKARPRSTISPVFA